MLAGGGDEFRDVVIGRMFFRVFAACSIVAIADELVTIYSHVDTFTTISALLPGGSSALSLPTIGGDDMDEPWHWGTPVAWDGEGRANVFVLDGGNGEQVITRVIWTLKDDAGRDQSEKTR